MSADKNRAWQRCMVLLREAAKYNGLTFHCEGGLAMANPDVHRLIRGGYLTRFRRPSVPKWSKEWHRLFPGPIHGHAFRTSCGITDKGRAAIANDHEGRR